LSAPPSTSMYIEKIDYDLGQVGLISREIEEQWENVDADPEMVAVTTSISFPFSADKAGSPRKPSYPRFKISSRSSIE